MKTENKVSLEQVLWSREKRVATQKELLEKYPGTLICFMLNIPGPEKVNKLFEKVFYEGLEKIQNGNGKNFDGSPAGTRKHNRI